jgi:hypothetical protein
MTTDIHQQKEKDTLEISSTRSGFSVLIDQCEKETITLPPDSPFRDWKEARKFAGPLPFTFTYQPETKTVLIIEGVRENWIPRPLQVLNYQFAFLDKMNLKDIRLANAFIIENIPYYWKKGKLEKWSAA